MVNPSLCQALRCPLLAKSFHDHVNTLKVLPSWNQTLQITHLPLKNLHSPLDHSTHSHPPVISQTIAVWFPDTALHTAGHSWSQSLVCYDGISMPALDNDHLSAHLAIHSCIHWPSGHLHLYSHCHTKPHADAITTDTTTLPT